MRKLVLVLPPLSGCYLIASGEIAVTCDEVAACSGSPDTDDDTDTPGDDTGTGWDDTGDDPGGTASLSMGVAFSATDGQSWTLSAFGPPDLSEQVYQRGGAGAFSGPLIFDPVQNRAAVAANGRLYVFGETVNEISSQDIPSDAAPVGLAAMDTGLCLITSEEVFWQGSSGTGGTLERLDTDGIIDGTPIVVFADADGKGLYLVARSSGDVASLYRYTGVGQGEVVASRFVSEPDQWLGGGGFIGPSAGVYFCSSSGGVYALADLIAGKTAARVQADADAPVRACAWDAAAERYLVATERGTVFALSESVGADALVFSPLDAALTATGAFLYGPE